MTSLSAGASADAPSLVPVQGFLYDDAGAPVNAAVNLQVSLFDAATGGAQMHSEALDVTVVDGFLTFSVGSVATLDLAIFRDSQLWMGIVINGGAELSPRMQLATVPYAGYAAHAGDADTVGGVPATAIARATSVAGSGITINASNEITVNRTEIDSWISTATGAIGPTNPQNHDRYTDAEARTAISSIDRYLINSGDVMTGPLTLNGATIANAAVEARAGIRSNCPSSMARVGSWCIDASISAPSNYTAALTSCDSRGLFLCPLEAIVTCDVLKPAGSTCSSKTDPAPGSTGAGDALWSADLSRVAGTPALSNAYIFRSRVGAPGTTEDVVQVQAVTGSASYYCCAPVFGL